MKKIKGNCLHCGKDIEMEPFGYVDEFDAKEQPHLRLGEPLIDINEQLCEQCRDRRLRGLERAREYLSDVPPAWFDPTYAGERWDEDY